MSRTDSGDFLSSEDIELLQTLSGYVGIAIENAKLYSSLQRKVEEYERLKEFSENIVESIHVGILAADLDDRVESWNSQMEKLTGVKGDPHHGGLVSEDGRFSLEYAECLASCGTAPGILCNDDFHERVDEARAAELVPACR